MLRNILCFCLIVIGICSFSFAVEGIAINTNVIDIVSEKNGIISGGFEVENLGDGYSSELFYTLSIMTKSQYEENFNNETMVLHQSKPQQFSLGAKEVKYISFNYMLPSDLLRENLLLFISFSDKTSEINGSEAFKKISSVGKSTEYVIPSDYDNTHFYKISGYNYPLSGPSIESNKSLKGYINLKSLFNEKVTLTPHYTVYKRLQSYENKEYMITTGNKITFNPKEEKTVELNLPKISEPDSYLVKVEFKDENYNRASYTYFFRYVVKGESAKILSTTATYDNESSKILFDMYCIGSADKQDVEVTLNANVYNAKTQEKIAGYSDAMTLGAFSIKYNFEIPVENVGEELEVDIRLNGKNKVLDSRNIKIEGNVTLDNKKKLDFEDVVNTKYEDAVRKLVLLGIISGYPDGTYRPLANIDRSELTVIALRLKNINADDYVQENAFTDVPSTHWASKYINAAQKEGIINGYGNGLFKPDINVTYSEAITILLNVMGYRSSVLSNGLEWPNNYIKEAKNIGLLDVIDVLDYENYANRGDVANMTFHTYLMGR